MTPKEKSEELYYKYYQLVADGPYPEDNAKKCSLIAIDEMMEVYASALHSMGIAKDIAELTLSPYLMQVKHEIENLKIDSK
jgi:hypothetical protein